MVEANEHELRIREQEMTAKIAEDVAAIMNSLRQTRQQSLRQTRQRLLPACHSLPGRAGRGLF